MALRTLSELRTRIARHTGMDPDDADNSTMLDDFINEAYQDLVRRANWRWLLTEGTFSSIAPLSAGTIAVSGTAVTGTGTAFVSASVGGYIHIQDNGDEVRKVATVTSATALTLDSSVSETVTTSNYSLYHSDYSLDARLEENTLQSIVDMKDSREIPIVPLQDAESNYPNQGGVLESDTAECASFLGRDSSNQVVIRLYPVPGEIRPFRWRGSIADADYTSDSDTPDIPERFKLAIEEGAKSLVYNWLGKFDRAQLHGAKFEAIIKDMKKAEAAHALHVYPPASQEIRLNTGTLRLPPPYGDGRY